MASQKTKSGGDGASFASSAENVVDQAKETAEDVIGQAREKAGQAAGQAQERAKSQISMGKDRVAESMESVASALRSSSGQMQGNEAGFVGDYMNRAADKVSEISQHLRQNDVNELMRETEDFARREPTIFLAGAFALGMIAARFLKSSGNAMQYDNRQQDWSGHAGYSEEYSQGSYAGGYDRDASMSYNESGSTGMGGVGRIDDQPYGGSVGMPGSGVMGDQPYTSNAGRNEPYNPGTSGSASAQNDME